MTWLAADISMRTAPQIIVTALLGCAAVGIVIAFILRTAARHTDEGRAAAERGDVRRAIRLIARFTRTQHRIFVVGFLLLSVEAVTQVFAWYPLAYMIDYFDGAQGPLGFPGVTSHRTATIAMLTFALLTLLAVNSATDSLAEICLARGGRTLGFRMRVGLFSHLQKLSLAFHDRSRKGDVMFRVVGDVKEFEQFVIDALSDLAGSVLLLIATIAFLLYEAWQVMLIGLLVIPGTSVISWYYSTRIKAAAKRQRAREGDLASATQEMLTSIRIVQTFGRGGHDEAKFVDNSSRAMTAAMDAARLEAWFSFIVTMFEAAAIGAVIWVGVYLLDHGRLSLGTLTLIALLIRQMFKPSKRIIKEWNIISKVFASVERIADLLDRPLTVQDEPGAVAAPPLKGRIEFRDVGFAYHPEPGSGEDLVAEPERPAALAGVSFTIEPGEVVAIAGPSGAGKTTIAQLIPRLYDPQSGAVLLDDLDVRGLTLDSVRSQISMVLQETVLLSGTVAENIAYGRPDAKRADIVAAAVRANADGFIAELPGGYDCDLSEQGSNLSGGQRQRIAIARALIRATPIMILDEPTTGLDADAAEQVLTGLRELMRGKTTVLISHDPDLLRSADRVLLIEAGRLVATGTPDLVLTQGGGAVVPVAAGPKRPARRPRRRAAPASVPTAGQIDPRQCEIFREELPSLEYALDEAAMREHLQHMLDPGHGGWRIEGCRAGKVLYAPGEGCTLRYRLELRNGNGGGARAALVGVRLFADPAAVEPFVRDRLQPLVERARGRDELAPFAHPVAMVGIPGAVAHAYPIDADIPTLVTATDADGMLRRLSRGLRWAPGEAARLAECRIEVAHYPRRRRCVLRYDLAEGAAGHVLRTVYGKLGGNGGALAPETMSAVHDDLSAHGLRVPRPLGVLGELDVELMEAIPGRPAVGRLQDARARGDSARSLELAIGACARIAARVHESDMEVARRRTLEDERAALHRELEPVRRLTPALGERLDRCVEVACAGAASHGPLPERLSHGDYTPSQVVFDGRQSGLLDFDGVCMAEPALDLGRFCAYLRVAGRKSAAEAGTQAESGDDLCRWFLGAYAEAAFVPVADRADLWGRAAVYEALGLAHIAASGWHQLKPARTGHALAALEERTACRPVPSR